MIIEREYKERDEREKVIKREYREYLESFLRDYREYFEKVERDYNTRVKIFSRIS